METNDIKNIWKSGTDKNIKTYSEAELNSIVVEAARKSMRNLGYKMVISIFLWSVIIYLICKIIFVDFNLNQKLLDSVTVLILLFSCIVTEYQSYKLNKYIPDTPIKEWLEYRIKRVENTLNFTSKYYIFLYVLGLCGGMSIYILNLHFAKVSIKLPFILIGMCSVVIILVIVLFVNIRNYKKILGELKE